MHGADGKIRKSPGQSQDGSKVTFRRPKAEDTFVPLAKGQSNLTSASWCRRTELNRHRRIFNPALYR